jgi:hypothetical protein
MDKNRQIQSAASLVCLENIILIGVAVIKYFVTNTFFFFQKL